jgi:PAS domain S-box-containing protein
MTASQASPPVIDPALRRTDLGDVFEAAQSLSNEIVTGRLVDRLMMIVVEHTGADRAILVLRRGASLMLGAIALASDAGLSVQRVGRQLLPTDLPVSMLLRAEESVRPTFVDDATAPNEFSQDEYLRSDAPRSVLCLPLKAPSGLVGALLLERELFPFAFTSAHRLFLEQLSPLIASSLRNAEIHESLQKEHAECRHSEAALRQSEERYALAIEASTDGHAEWLADKDVFYASPRLLEQWGISPDLLHTRPQQILDLFPLHPEDRDRVIALLDQHRNGTERRLEFDTRVVRNDEVRWMHCTVLLVRDEAGALSRMSITTSDVTERIRAQEELRASEERYALALVGTNEGPYDWNLRTNLIFAPPRTQELLGLSPGSVWRSREEWVSQITHYPGDHERLEAALVAHFAGQTPRYAAEVRIVLASGEIRWFLYRGTVMRDPGGTPYRMVGSLGDITERKRQQEEMARMEIRLRQAERFEAVGTLAGGIAHDFNNILGAILGFGERALRATREGSRLHHDLSNVVIAGERGRTLVDRILSFSRGTIGERAPVHVERVLREALSLLQAKLPPNVKLRTRLHAGRAAILGDAVQVHQLLMNLGTNAAHAMPQPGTLTVSLDVAEISQSRQARLGSIAAGSWIILQVADQGRGMAPEVLERIFDPFFTTKEAGVGTGLGLSLVLRIVTQYGGAIDVDSALGGGSTFTVYLPRCGEAPEEVRGARKAHPRGQGQRVMVVDDEEGLLELTTHALLEWGYQPTGFGSAQAAIDAFRAKPDEFDVLLTDLRMPGMSGGVLIREARSLRPLLPVILISGFVGDVAQAGSGTEWADEVLTKPLRVSALATSLARILNIA